MKWFQALKIIQTLVPKLPILFPIPLPLTIDFVCICMCGYACICVFVYSIFLIVDMCSFMFLCTSHHANNPLLKLYLLFCRSLIRPLTKHHKGQDYCGQATRFLIHLLHQHAHVHTNACKLKQTTCSGTH